MAAQPKSCGGLPTVAALAALVTGLVLGLPETAHAYIDPGSGGIILQVLLGGIAGLAVLIKLYWGRLRDRLRPGSRNRRPAEESAQASAAAGRRMQPPQDHANARRSPPL